MSFIPYLISFKVTKEQDFENNPENNSIGNFLSDFTLEENFDVFRELYGHAGQSDVYEVTYDDKPGEIFEERVQRPWGVLGKYDYLILKSFLGDYGQDYVYKMSDKILLKNEITDLLSKEKSLTKNAQEYLKKFLILVEKSIELTESTIIIEYEV